MRAAGAAVLPLLLTLSACLVSERAIIAAGMTEFPLPAGDYVMIEADNEPMPITIWHSATDTIALDPDGPSILRFRAVSDGVYAMQSDEDGFYLYGAMRVRGDEINLWLPQCAALTAEERRRLRLTLTDGSECEVADWESLASATVILVAREAPGGLLRREAREPTSPQPITNIW